MNRDPWRHGPPPWPVLRRQLRQARGLVVEFADFFTGLLLGLGVGLCCALLCFVLAR